MYFTLSGIMRCKVLRSSCLYVSLYLSVCLFVRSRFLKPCTCLNFITFSIHVNCGRGSVILWRQRNTLCTSGFVFHIILHIRWLDSSGHWRATRHPLSEWYRLARILQQMIWLGGAAGGLTTEQGATFAVFDCLLKFEKAPSASF